MNTSARLEKALKELQKLPGNKKCADCTGTGALAPQYVCLNFSTFICTNCATAHRSLNHRVKGSSMSTFTAEEIAKLQAGGNEVARAQYQSGYTQPLPDAEDLRSISAFIKAVYIDKRFAAGQSHAQPAAAAAATGYPIAAAPARTSFDAFAGPDTHAPPPLPTKKPLPPMPAVQAAASAPWNVQTQAPTVPPRGGSPAWGGGDAAHTAGFSRPASAASHYASSDVGGAMVGLSNVSSSTSLAASPVGDPFSMFAAPPPPAPAAAVGATLQAHAPEAAFLAAQGRHELSLDLFGPEPTQQAAPQHMAPPGGPAYGMGAFGAAPAGQQAMAAPYGYMAPQAQYAPPAPQAAPHPQHGSTNPFDSFAAPPPPAQTAALSGVPGMMQQGQYHGAHQPAPAYQAPGMPAAAAGWPQPVHAAPQNAAALWGAEPVATSKSAPAAPDPFADLLR